MAVIFVNQSAAGSQDGSSWENAFTDLQSAIAQSTAGDEIWLAKGTYVPGQTRAATFTLDKELAIYGGFDGTEATRADRDWQNNPTILSGDIGTANDDSDNSHHVVTATATAGVRLDGVIVESGNTTGDNNNDDGGGIYNTAMLTLENSVVRDNLADDDGGGIRNSGTIFIINSSIVDNTAASNGSITSGGGGLLNTVGATATVVNSTFSGNEGGNGGAIRNDGDLTLTNTTLSGNTAYESGGGLNNTTNPLNPSAASGSATIVNSTITQNTTLSSSNNQGGGIINFGQLSLANSIVAGNAGNDDVRDALFGNSTSQGYNLIGNGDASAGFVVGNNNDQVGTATAAVDALLAALQNNGGFTQTHLPTAMSSAIDGGNNALLVADQFDLDGNDDTAEAIAVDQRGAGFDRILEGTVDIGAVESTGDETEPSGNSAPTAIRLDAVRVSLAEDTDTSMPIRLADIVVTDSDGLGNNLLSIVGRYDDLFEAIGPDVFETIATEYFDSLEDTDLSAVDADFLRAIATDFFEAMGTEFFETLMDEFLAAADIDSLDDVDSEFVKALSEQFLETVDAEFFETIAAEFLETLESSDRFEAISDDFLELVDAEFFEAIADEFLDTADAEFFETLANEFLAAAAVDSVDDIDAEWLEEATKSLLGVNDPNIFEISGDGLFLKAGAQLDFEEQTQYNIVVQVDDPTVGSTPDASVDFKLQITDVDDSPLQATPEQLLNVISDDDESSLSISVSQVESSQVIEIIVAETDAEGRIDGIAPTEDGYLAALIASSESVLSTLEAGTFDGLDLMRSLAVSSNSYLQFAIVQDGTLDGLRQGGSGTVQIATPLAGDQDIQGSVLQVQALEHGKVQLGFDTNGDRNFEDIILTAIFGSQKDILGAGLQGGPESELVDLRDVTGTVSAEFTVYREASFDNVIGFFAIENESGQVLGLDDATLISPGEAGYVRAAIARRISTELTGTDGQITRYSAQVQGGQLLSSFIVSDGAIADLTDGDTNNDPAIYFTHLGANSDSADHVRLLGDNLFGFEDMAGGGDQDFDDVVVKMKFSA